MKRKHEETPEEDERADAKKASGGGEDAAPSGENERLETELAAAQKLAQQLKHQTLELTADLDNQAKRFTRERQVVREEIVTRLAREMIEVLDNLDAVVRAMSDEERASPIGRGVVLTQVVFLEKLKSFGVERVETIGRPFDPAWHEAMSQTERADVAPGTVLGEWTSGYRLGSKLVRAAKVEVAKAPGGQGSEDDTDDDTAASGN